MVQGLLCQTVGDKAIFAVSDSGAQMRSALSDSGAQGEVRCV